MYIYSINCQPKHLYISTRCMNFVFNFFPFACQDMAAFNFDTLYILGLWCHNTTTCIGREICKQSFIILYYKNIYMVDIVV